MTGLVRKATLLTACGVLMAAAAMAGVPSPANSTTPGFIRLVGSSVAGADTTDGVFQITVRDLANNPINGSAVSVDFSAAADLRVCTNQIDPNSVVTCPNPALKTVRRFTNSAGVVRFTLIGAGPASAVAGTDRGTVKIFADGILLSSTSASTGLICASPDENGVGGLTGLDISRVLADNGTVGFEQRSDINGTGTNTGTDIGALLTLIGGARSTVSCASYCP